MIPIREMSTMSAHLLTPLPSSISKTLSLLLSQSTTLPCCKHLPIDLYSQGSPTRPSPLLSSFFLSSAIALTLTSPLPCLAITPQPPFFLSSPITPFSQSKNLPTGLENGRIRACPSINPGCISSNPQSSSFSLPWQIPENSLDNAFEKLQNAIFETQRNVKIQAIEGTPDGKYLQAEVDGGFGRDVMEFLVRGDVVSYRCMATKVNYVYPFTTAFGDSKGQEQRLRMIVDQLEWFAPSLSSMD